jgi:hypothetical protein
MAQAVCLLLVEDMQCVCELCVQSQFLCIKKHSPGASIEGEKDQTMAAWEHINI